MSTWYKKRTKIVQYAGRNWRGELKPLGNGLFFWQLGKA